jgi:REP element-mobilizing transposase RayT
MARRSGQAEFQFRTWGGARRGAGRKRRGRGRVPHRRREAFKARWPVHITLRCVRGVGRLRKFKIYQRLREAMAGASARLDFSICHFSVQGDHLHLICEAHNLNALTNGMRSLKNRITKKLNPLLSRSGSAFDDRYHMRVLRSPTTVRNAIGYVLCNGRKHGEHLAATGTRDAAWLARWIDPFSSVYYFDGWLGKPDGRLGRPPPGPPPVAEPQTWLLSAGWRQVGLISPSHTPRS